MPPLNHHLSSGATAEELQQHYATDLEMVDFLTDVTRGGYRLSVIMPSNGRHKRLWPIERAEHYRAPELIAAHLCGAMPPVVACSQSGKMWEARGGIALAVSSLNDAAQTSRAVLDIDAASMAHPSAPPPHVAHLAAGLALGLAAEAHFGAVAFGSSSGAGLHVWLNFGCVVPGVFAMWFMNRLKAKVLQLEPAAEMEIRPSGRYPPGMQISLRRAKDLRSPLGNWWNTAPQALEHYMHLWEHETEEAERQRLARMQERQQRQSLGGSIPDEIDPANLTIQEVADCWGDVQRQEGAELILHCPRCDSRRRAFKANTSNGAWRCNECGVGKAPGDLWGPFWLIGWLLQTDSPAEVFAAIRDRRARGA